jgi:hypothetical protein
MTITKVNVYRDEEGEWYYAAWADDEYDHNYTLASAETEAQAIAEVAAMWPQATVEVVDPVE